MAYTEIKERNSRRYYYRVLSVRKKDKVTKKREYLGVNLSKKKLKQKEINADKILDIKKETESLRKIKAKIIKVLKQHNIEKAGIFGSYARGDHKKESDIDILIQPPKGMGLEFIEVKLELENRLKRKVDLVTYKGVHPLIRKNVFKEEVKII
ncbi:nucleotidyltransferase family protein [Candidatus Woesearchaeota archaeon]|nr:nucleotidyltransferase family protein [Candidatus Woesearchaeota archaeon]